MSVAILVYLFIAPIASIGLDFYLDGLDERSQDDVDRLTIPLPDKRESLLPLDWADTWPQRQTPMDLPQRVGLIVAEDRPGRHRAPDDMSDTDQFWIIVSELDRPCSHCSSPEDGEPAHAGCPGCSCPCSSVIASA